MFKIICQILLFIPINYITSNVVEIHVYLNMSQDAPTDSRMPMLFIIIILKHVPFKSVLCRKSSKRGNYLLHFKGENALHCKSAKSFHRHFQIINILLLY